MQWALETQDVQRFRPSEKGTETLCAYIVSSRWRAKDRQALRLSMMVVSAPMLPGRSWTVGLDTALAIQSNSLNGLRIGQQLAAYGIRCANEDHRDIQMLHEMLDHLMEGAIPSGQQQRTPLPVPVRPHQMEGQADINGLLLDVLKCRLLPGCMTCLPPQATSQFSARLYSQYSLTRRPATGRRIGPAFFPVPGRP